MEKTPYVETYLESLADMTTGGRENSWGGFLDRERISVSSSRMPKKKT